MRSGLIRYSRGDSSPAFQGVVPYFKATNFMTTTTKPISLKLTDNSKTKFRKHHLNSFGLNFGPPSMGGTCCGATSGKGGCLDVRDGNKRETCYMFKVAQIYKGVKLSLEHNTDLLRDKTEAQMVPILKATVYEFVRKNQGAEPYFRLHYSGDFFSAPYAKAWVTVMRMFPQIRFWVYTRSHNLVKHLVDVENLTCFISIDPQNQESGYKIAEQFNDRPNVGLAWMGNTAPSDKRWVTCPETSGKLKNSPDKGACATCRLCVDRLGKKVRNIQFLIH